MARPWPDPGAAVLERRPKGDASAPWETVRSTRRWSPPGSRVHTLGSSGLIDRRPLFSYHKQCYWQVRSEHRPLCCWTHV